MTDVAGVSECFDKKSKSDFLVHFFLVGGGGGGEGEGGVQGLGYWGRGGVCDFSIFCFDK